MSDRDQSDNRETIVIYGGFFLFFIANISRTLVRGTAPQLRAEILRASFRPGLILGMHMAWPAVLAFHATNYLGTYLRPKGPARWLILGIFGAATVGGAVLMWVGLGFAVFQHLSPP